MPKLTYKLIAVCVTVGTGCLAYPAYKLGSSWIGGKQTSVIDQIFAKISKGKDSPSLDGLNLSERENCQMVSNEWEYSETTALLKCPAYYFLYLPRTLGEGADNKGEEVLKKAGELLKKIDSEAKTNLDSNTKDYFQHEYF